MTTDQYAPSLSPTLSQQADALRKGLGRAQLWARSGHLDPSLLWEACLTDWRYDQQFEHARGWWLWECIEALQCGDRFREPLLNAVRELANERNVDQLCQLASEYASRGDQEFLQLLYGIVERQSFDEHLTVESELIDIDGEPAFQFIAKARGRCLATRDWQWHDAMILDKAIDLWGAPQVAALLGASSDSHIARFREVMPSQANESTNDVGTSLREQFLGMTAQQLIERVELEPELAKRSPFYRGWGMFAAESELNIVQDRMFQVTDESTLLNYLRVFSNRALPQFDARLLTLSEHSNRDVRRSVFAALEMNTHPLVRERALRLLAAGETEGVGLFIRNFEPGDEARLLDKLSLPEDDFLRHRVLMHVKSILSENANAMCQELGVLVYFSTPCGQCRYFITKLLFERKACPDWLREECRCDAEKDTQELFPD